MAGASKSELIQFIAVFFEQQRRRPQTPAQQQQEDKHCVHNFV
jgi:hypothetical protein